MIIQKVLYGLTDNVEGEYHKAMLIDNIAKRVEARFINEALGEWDKEGRGSFREFIEYYVPYRWLGLVLKN